MKCVYVVQLEVPLGIRSGRMFFNVTEENVSGFLEILGRAEEFKGTLKKDGFVQIYGCIASPIRNIFYLGVGIMKDAKLELELHGKRNTYKLTGYQCNFKQEAKGKNEEIL